MSCLEHPCGRQSPAAALEDTLEDTPGHVLDVDSEQKSGLTGEQTTFIFLAAQGNGRQHAHLVHLAVSNKCLDYWGVCVEGWGDGMLPGSIHEYPGRARAVPSKAGPG